MWPPKIAVILGLSQPPSTWCRIPESSGFTLQFVFYHWEQDIICFPWCDRLSLFSRNACQIPSLKPHGLSAVPWK